MDGWRDGGREGCGTVHVGSRWHPETAGMAPPQAWLFGAAPCHLPAGCRETGLKVGELGLLGWHERWAGTARVVTLAPVGNSLKPNHRAQLFPSSAPKLQQNNHKNTPILPWGHWTIAGSWPNPFQGCGNRTVFPQDQIPSSSADNPRWHVTTTAVLNPAQLRAVARPP